MLQEDQVIFLSKLHEWVEWNKIGLWTDEDLVESTIALVHEFEGGVDA